MEKYDFKSIEKKWQERWEKSGAHKAKVDPNVPKFYCLDFFPYPSGEGLHVGHWRGYVLSDIIARYQKLHGKEILHPMGYDAFGLPAENAAIKNNIHPKIFTEKAIERFRKQLKEIGAMYDWEREINSSDPNYYKWTQWLFLELYKAGLAYRKKAPVNWCPTCQTVLANEQVASGECERCGSAVTKKELTQWFFKITNYAERLLNNLEHLDWPERTKTLQRNWIGKSEGAMIKFPIADTDLSIEVFTTRPDTLFGATFMVLAPEHRLIQEITAPKHVDEIEKYILKTKAESDIFREQVERKKTGVFTGAYAINPINKKKIPIWVADYVLTSYCTGACMCVPGHDLRDFDFAKKFDLPIIQVISADGRENGVMINSGKFNGLASLTAKEKITQELKTQKAADFQTNYRLRDWLISRQRYWGAPIPIIYCKTCGEVPVPKKDLPVLLPTDVEFRPKGESPLKQSKKFTLTTCPNCGGKATRETDTMDTFVDSSWYYFRFTDPQNDRQIACDKAINSWLPVDLYIGGIEHATMHLLYARFVSLALHDLKIINFNNLGEPFAKLFNIGLIYLHGAKMSKSKGNVVNPDELVDRFGSDALRGYEMFVGPADQDSVWQVSGIAGISRFLEKIWRFSQNLEPYRLSSALNSKLVSKTITKINDDIENFRINTAISALMEFFNQAEKNLSTNDFKSIVIAFSPIFPHLAEEVWRNLGEKDSIFKSTWPVIGREDKNITEDVILPIQINGKLKTTITIKNNATLTKAVALARESAKIKASIKGKKVVKIVYIPGKIINFVLD